MIVDAHAHIISQVNGISIRGAIKPLSYGNVRLGDGEVIRLLPPLATYTSFSAEVLLEYMDWTGIDKAVLLQAPFYGDMNSYVHTAVEKWPDRFIGAGLLDPMSASAASAFDYLVNELGFRAIKLELSEETGLGGLYKNLNLGDTRFRWFWEAVNRQGLTVTLDLGPIGGRSYQTRELRELVERYQNARWVIAHLCHPSPQVLLEPEIEASWVEQILLANQPNVWLDLAALPYYFQDEDYPYPSVRHFVCRAIELVGVKKLLWGSDVPGLLAMLTYQQMQGLYMHHCDCLSESDKTLIFGANAMAAYG